MNTIYEATFETQSRGEWEDDVIGLFTTRERAEIAIERHFQKEFVRVPGATLSGERGDETRTVLNTGGTVNFYYTINERFVDVGFEE